MAKRRVDMTWESRAWPSTSLWLKDIVYCQDSLALYAEELPTSSRPKDIWEPLLQYLRSCTNEAPFHSDA